MHVTVRIGSQRLKISLESLSWLRKQIERECEALLAVMDLHVPVPALQHPTTDARVYVCAACRLPDLLEKEWAKVEDSLYPCETVRLLMSAYQNPDTSGQNGHTK